MPDALLWTLTQSAGRRDFEPCTAIDNLRRCFCCSRTSFPRPIHSGRDGSCALAPRSTIRTGVQAVFQDTNPRDDSSTLGDRSSSSRPNNSHQSGIAARSSDVPMSGHDQAAKSWRAFIHFHVGAATRSDEQMRRYIRLFVVIVSTACGLVLTFAVAAAVVFTSLPWWLVSGAAITSTAGTAAAVRVPMQRWWPRRVRTARARRDTTGQREGRSSRKRRKT